MLCGFSAIFFHPLGGGFAMCKNETAENGGAKKKAGECFLFVLQGFMGCGNEHRDVFSCENLQQSYHKFSPEFYGNSHNAFQNKVVFLF